MNNTRIYSIIFGLSRLITIFFLMICSFTILNAKYMWFENFFIIIKEFSFAGSIEKESLSSFIYKLDIFKRFIIYVNYDTYFIIYLIILLILSKFVFKKYKYSLVFGAILSILSYYCFVTICLNSHIDFIFIFCIVIVYFILFVFNFKFDRIPKIFLLIPIASDFLFTNHIINYIYRAKSRNNTSVIFSINIILIFLLSININLFQLSNNLNNKILDGVFYSIQLDEDKLIFNEEIEKQLFSYDINLNKFKKYSKLDMVMTLQSFALNKTTNDCYIYDEGTGNFLTLDVKNNFNLKNKVLISKKFGDLNSHERVLYDEYNKKVLILLEAGDVYLFNPEDYNNVYFFKISDRNDSVIYNPFRNSYLISYWYNVPFLTEIFALDYKITKIDAPKMQGYIAISKQNKEIYVAFHQQGKILVYDAQTMQLKRKIKSNYTVKNISYDEDLNVLIAPAYFIGYVDIFLMDGTDKLLTREFIGYELREAKFDSKKENLYVVSKNGLYKKKINIKKLIANVSHKTK